jgi:hypothetical protein
VRTAPARGGERGRLGRCYATADADADANPDTDTDAIQLARRIRVLQQRTALLLETREERRFACKQREPSVSLDAWRDEARSTPNRRRLTDQGEEGDGGEGNRVAGGDDDDEPLDGIYASDEDGDPRI